MLDSIVSQCFLSKSLSNGVVAKKEATETLVSTGEYEVINLIDFRSP
jgi:hypothetical protein